MGDTTQPSSSLRLPRPSANLLLPSDTHREKSKRWSVPCPSPPVDDLRLLILFLVLLSFPWRRFMFEDADEYDEPSPSKSTIRLRELSGHHSDRDSLLRSCLFCRRRSSAAESSMYRSSREFLLVSLLLMCFPLPPLRMAREPRDEAAASTSRG